VGESLSEAVAPVIGLIDESGLAYDFGPMGTTVEGEWDEVMGLIKKCRDKMLASFSRVYLVIKIDERKGAAGRITGKTKSVEEKLGKELRG
jgi:uncharacterized protein (TIGR00106 family)